MNRDLPEPVGHTQNAVMNDGESVAFCLRPMYIREGAMKVVVAFFGGSPSSFFDSSSLLGEVSPSPELLLLLTLLLYFMSFSTALTELVIFHPPSLKSSSSCTKFSTPSALYQLYGMLKNEQDITWVQRCDGHKINRNIIPLPTFNQSTTNQQSTHSNPSAALPELLWAKKPNGMAIIIVQINISAK